VLRNWAKALYRACSLPLASANGNEQEALFQIIAVRFSGRIAYKATAALAKIQHHTLWVLVLKVLL